MKVIRSLAAIFPFALLIIMAAQAVVTGLLFDWGLCIIELIIAAVSAAAMAVFYLSRQRRTVKLLSGIMNQLSGQSRVLMSLTIPVVAVRQGKIEWYNTAFRSRVLSGRDCLQKDCDELLSPSAFEKSEGGSVSVEYGGRLYTVYICMGDDDCYICYFIDQTEFDRLSEQYELSRPVVALIAVDNLDELQKDIRDSEKAQLGGAIEKQIENWAADAHGVCRKLSYDRFIMITEERYLKKMADNRFKILGEVRAVNFGDRGNATLSIGIGHGGADFSECEEFARQALDMALGRGGDQVAVKGKKDFEFFGGTSGTAAKRTRVRTRVVASALRELIESSENVLIMGHRFADLDCFGAAYGLHRAITSMGKPSKIVINKDRALCSNLVDYVSPDGDAVISPEAALNDVGRKTLLIVVDSQRANFLESPELFNAVDTVVVIDHHRKTVDHIDRAVIFYHEPYASSTCEMVTELLQYMAERIGRMEADALLSGIMLDTRNFVLHTGVRTFEASAYLRGCGANPVTVKQFFRNSMDIYKEKAAIVSTAEIYGDCAISGSYSEDNGVRIAASQAADEMLGIDNVNASFVLFVTGDTVNISARSLGAVNVQLIMEQLGGGGHLTMAAAQLKDTNIDDALKLLVSAIDVYRQNLAK